MHRCLYASLLLALSVAFSGVQAFADDGDRVLRKLVIDNTVTYAGHEFYRAFRTNLMRKTGSVYFDQVAVKETGSRRSGKVVGIEFQEQLVYRTTIYPADPSIDKKAKKAARIVSARISNAQLNALFSQDRDLAGNEL
ncbi:MAG: CsgE family curli-type amyloid fiber assembly protein [Mariprofundaceae bacterium]|nr:CsgE family curli-type amyloid fiber assembly protein [Mariprofundaceae bacterium]